MDIAPTGAIQSTCARFAALLKRRNIHKYLGISILDIFPLLGKTEPALSGNEWQNGFPPILDLSVQTPGTKSFIIRWISTPRYLTEAGAGGWQLTGMKVYADPFPPLAAAEEPPSTAVKITQDIIVTTNLENNIVFWNDAAEHFYGISSTSAVGKPLHKVADFQYCYTTAEEVQQILKKKGFWEGETTYISSDGKKSYLISSIRYVKDTDRRISGIMLVSKDITEEKELAPQDQQWVELQLRHYSEQISQVLENISDGFFVLDQSFRVQLWNREAERIMHIPSAEMLGQSIWDKLPELVDTDTWQCFHKAFKKKMTVTFDQYYIRSDRWLEMSLYPFDQGVFAYFKDVTLRKKQEGLLALEKRVLELNTGKRMSLRTLLNFFLKGIQNIFPGMYCCVLTLDEDGEHVRLLSAPSLPAVYSYAIDGLPIGPKAGSCGTAMFRKETVIVSDIATDPLWENHSDLALQFGLRACWSLPVLNGKDEVLAAFAVYYTVSKSPTNFEMDIFERVANLVTIIIESKKAEDKLLQQELNKQKLIAQAMVDAQEKERAEIGKELHDNINQILSTTKLYLELAKSDTAERLNLINRSAGNIHQAIHEIRNISRSLVPASIGDLGLVDSITDLVESIQTTKAIHVEFYPIGNFDEKISDKTKLMLFRIIQEQVNNVLRHSSARNLIIELTFDETENSTIELSITDDGKGFDPEKMSKKGLGLSNIMSRADLFGGKVTIQSAPGAGCKLRVQVPVI